MVKDEGDKVGDFCLASLEETEEGAEKMFEEIIADYFPKLIGILRFNKQSKSQVDK